MMKKRRWYDRVLRLLLTDEQRVSKVVLVLTQARFRPLAHSILKAVHFHWRNRPARHDSRPVYHAQPQGPFNVADQSPVSDLLVFTPRALDSQLIDDLTGRYGYSHVAVDIGETDQDTRKPLMVESMPLQKVHRSFQDIYGPRPFIRIPLGQAGVEPQAFRSCILEKMGEPYDDLEVLTWGAVDDPAKQICSDLAMVCLPEPIQEDIARQRLAGKLSPGMASVHRSTRHGLHTFVSPNGFARYFGAPRGEQVNVPDQRVKPRRREHWRDARMGSRPAGVLLGLLITGLVVAWMRQRRLSV